MSVHDPCPCGRSASYGECCAPFHDAVSRAADVATDLVEAAPTAERLMRSRFSAFALGHAMYLLETWHPDTRPAALEVDDEIEWKRLFIESAEAGGPFDEHGTVTFTAIGRTPEGRFEQRERSRFVRLQPGNRWVYVDGEEV